MALDKLVDGTQLDADLTSVADAIREKTGDAEELSFPSGFVSAIGNISGGGKIASGEVILRGRSFALSILHKGADTYRYLAVWYTPMEIQKPGYKAFFFLIADFKTYRKWFGYTNNAGTADVGNMYGNNSRSSGSTTGANDNGFWMANGTSATTGSVFGYFMPGTYKWAAWGDINE